MLQKSGIVSAKSILRDLKERKKAEALLKSEEKYRELTESISDMFYAMDKDLRYTYWNKASEKFTGISAKDAIGKSLTEIFPDVKGAEIEQFYLGILRTRKPQSFVNKYQLEGKDFVFEINAYPTKDGVSVFVKDVTERKKMEEALMKSEEKWHSLVENAPNIILIASHDGEIQFINRTVIDVTPEEVVGKNVYDFIDPEYHDLVRKTIEHVFQTGEGGSYEIRGTGPEGKVSWYFTQVGPIKHDGHVVSVTLITTDVTETKEMQEKLEYERGLFNALMDNVPDALYFKDTKSRFTRINKAHAGRMGASDVEEAIGKTDFDFYAEGFARKTYEDEQKIVRTGELLINRVEQIGEAYGQTRWVSATKVPIKNKDGQVIGLVGISRDITHLKEVEAELKRYSQHLEELVQERTRELLESEKRYSVVVEEANEGIFVCKEKKVVFVNRRGTEILGYSKDELIGFPMGALIDEKYSQIAMDRYERRMRGEKVPETYEVEVKPKTGESIHVEISATRIDYQGQPADLIIIRDIEERKRMEEEHIQLERLIAIGEMATIVAHDIRNPLTSITNASFYIKKTFLNHTDEECKATIKMLDIIQRETIYASNIINDLLDFANKSLPEKIEQNINELVQASLTASNIPKNIKIITNFAEKSVASVDEKQVKKVFFNIIKNAVQSMPNGGKLTITTNETKDKIIITFTDTGQGIPETDKANIFKPFFTTKAKGTGLGLCICKNIVELHGGIIDFESKVGQGTTFIINLLKF